MRDTQHFVDSFYRKRGPCCAGCDWWRFHNSVVGDCTRSAPVAGGDRVALLGAEGLSLPEDAGHILTPRGHLCGEFIDTHDWEADNVAQ